MTCDLKERICETQGELFEYAAQEGYDFEKFVNAYMQSDFCERYFDTEKYSRFQLQCPTVIVSYLDEIKLEKYSDDLAFDAAVAFWLGFVYRALYFATGVGSREIINRIPLGELLSAYPGLHTIPYQEAVEDLVRWYFSKETEK